jgi:two-component system, cell cycle response regulator
MGIQGSTLKVLLIAGNPGDTRLLRRALAKAGTTPFELVVAERLEDGLKGLSEIAIDVVLLDLLLPDEGPEAVTRTHDAAPNVPIVVLTGTDDEQLAIQAVQSGAQDYLVKGQMSTTLLVRALRYAIERHRLQAEVRDLSLRDDLTGLYNRRGFLTFAERQLKLAHRTKTGLLFVFADLDSLKQINDTFGHQQGDLALIQTAHILRRTFRDSDIIARLGGDEFTTLTFDDSEESATIMTARLQEELKKHNERQKPSHKLSITVGSAIFDPANPVSLEELMARADKALYEHKHSREENGTAPYPF